MIVGLSHYIIVEFECLLMSENVVIERLNVCVSGMVVDVNEKSNLIHVRFLSNKTTGCIIRKSLIDLSENLSNLWIPEVKSNFEESEE